MITHDVERLAAFWERVTGLPVARPVPVFAELRTPTGTVAIGNPATVGMLGAAAPVPVMLEPTDMPWGNRSMILRDPGGGLVNLLTPTTPETKAKYGL